MAKKLINDPADVVREALEGAVLGQPGTALLGDQLIVVRADRVVTADNRDERPRVLDLRRRSRARTGPRRLCRRRHAHRCRPPGRCSPHRASTPFWTGSAPRSPGTAGSLLIVKSYTAGRPTPTSAWRGASPAAKDSPSSWSSWPTTLPITESDANAGRRGLAGTVLVHKVAGQRRGGPAGGGGGAARAPGRRGVGHDRSRAERGHRAGSRWSGLRAAAGRDRDRSGYPRRARGRPAHCVPRTCWSTTWFDGSPRTAVWRRVRGWWRWWDRPVPPRRWSFRS